MNQTIKQNNNNNNKNYNQQQLPLELQNYDPELVERIESEIIQSGQPITFDDIAGLDFAKKCVQEVICWYI